MNFKTTLVLLGLLIAGGIAVFVTRDKGGESAQKTVESQQKVFTDVVATDVTKLAITASDGTKTAIEKTDAKWRLTAPVPAAAEAFEVDALVRAITGLETTNVVTGASTGIDKPKFTIELTAGGKDYTLLVGDKLAASDGVYVSRKDKSETQVVASELLEKLAKPASSYRDPKLVAMTVAQVGQVTLAKADGTKIVLVRAGGNWKVTEPKEMPAEKNDVDDIILGLTGLRANEWIAEDTKDAASYQLDQPRITATLSGMPTTLPAGVAAPSATTAPTSQPASVTIKIGRYEDALKHDIYVTTSQNPVVAKVGATVLGQIDKKPLDLRDRKVFEIDPAQVASITIASDLVATTKPTSRPASKTTVTLKRRHEAVALGPTPIATKPATTTSTAPSTGPTSNPATTQATTQAATQPLTKWEVVAGESTKPADDAKVDALLSQFHPLRATKYLESAPSTQPTASYVVTVVTQAAGGEPAKTIELRLVDPGNSKPIDATYNDLAFEADRFIVDRLSGDFLKGSKPAPGAGGLGNEVEAPGEAPRPTFAP